MESKMDMENECAVLPMVSTPINVDLLEEYLADHPDRGFVNYLCSGLRNGFDTGVKDMPAMNFECNNLQSAMMHPSIVSETIAREVEQGYVIGPFIRPPSNWPHYRLNPIGIVSKKHSDKKRLIIDMSHPHDGTSVNDHISKEDFSLKYVKVDDAIMAIKKAGTGAWLCKWDLVDAFKNCPILPSQWPLFGFRFQGKMYFCVKLCFGCRSSPKIFDTLSVALCWIATNKFGIPCLFHLLDDILSVDSPGTVAERTMAIILLILTTCIFVGCHTKRLVQ